MLLLSLLSLAPTLVDQMPKWFDLAKAAVLLEEECGNDLPGKARRHDFERPPDSFYALYVILSLWDEQWSVELVKDLALFCSNNVVVLEVVPAECI